VRDYLTEKRFEEVAVKRVRAEELHGDVRTAYKRAHDPAELASDNGERREPKAHHKDEAAIRRYALLEASVEQRNPDGSERYAELELLRLALPRRVFTLSQIKYCADRVKWLYDNRSLIGGLQWVEEPRVLRFFFGRMKEIGYWQEELAKKFRTDFGDSL
jgi:tryptophanase